MFWDQEGRHLPILQVWPGAWTPPSLALLPHFQSPQVHALAKIMNLRILQTLARIPALCLTLWTASPISCATGLPVGLILLGFP